MQWLTFLGLYGISLPIFLVVDILWIGFLASNFYNQQIGDLRGDINWTAATAFYVLFMLGMTYFAIYPGWQSGSLLTAAQLGAMYGFFVYAAYNLTNMATLKGWSWAMTLVDMSWGIVLGASVATLTVWCAMLWM